MLQLFDMEKNFYRRRNR